MSLSSSGGRLRTGLLAAGILLLLAEIAARLLPPSWKTPTYTYLAAGHEEYFGTARVTVPYEARRPYYWLPRPSTPLTNRQGFRGTDWETNKPPGVFRIACLGCSCTMGGQEPYAQRLDRLLREAVGPGRFEVLNAGVGSSSTHQIRQLLQHHVLPYRPDLLIVYSGWNDLAVHDGRPDARHRLPAPWQVKLQRLLQPSHLHQLLGHLAGASARRHPLQRVPVQDYERNLRDIVDLGRRHGARTLLCTFADGLDERVIATRRERRPGPHDWQHDLYRVYLPHSADPREQWRFAVSQYHEATRQAAAAEGAEFLDLHAALAPRPAADAPPGLAWFKDGTHFTERGLQEVALHLARQVVDPTERDTLDRYAASPAYFLTNAVTFAAQFQFAAAADFLQRAGTEDPALRALIEQERPFYDRYEAARHELSNGGDPARAAAWMRECLELRPGNHDVRLDLAEVEAQEGQHARALDLALGAPRDYSPPQAHRALWIGARAARDLSQRELALRLLRELTQRFPEDPMAAEALRQVGGS
jgi:lysophospholipase L1-like esterase